MKQFALYALIVFGMLCRPLFPVGAQSEPPGLPTLSIISPGPGEVLEGSDVKVIVALPAGITFSNYHVHLWLDTMPAHDNALAVTLSNTTEYQFHNVFSGLHTLYGEVFRNDHVPLQPKLSAHVEFETVGQEIKSSPVSQENASAPPDTSGTQFLPPGKNNTIFAVLLIVVAIAILWFTLGRSHKRH